MNFGNPKEMIRIRGLEKSYGDHAVLRGIDFDVLPSQVVVVIGPSGSGKSTLLRCCNGLEVAQGGTCLLYTSPSPRDRQKSRMPSSA